MSPWSDAVVRHDLALRIQELLREVYDLTDQWRRHDSDIRELDEGLAAEQAAWELGADPVAGACEEDEEQLDLPW